MEAEELFDRIWPVVKAPFALRQLAGFPQPFYRAKGTGMRAVRAEKNKGIAVSAIPLLQ